MDLQSLNFFMKLFLSFALLVLTALGAAYFAKQELVFWSTRPVELAEPTIVQIPLGTSLATLAGLLADQGVVTSDLRFRIWVRLFSRYSEFQAGQYRFTDQTTPEQIAAMIRKGEVYRPVVLEVTIPEGFRLNQIFDRFVEAGVGSRAQFDALASDRALLESLGVKGSSLEGFFYPATYRFYEKPVPQTVVKEGVAVFFRNLPPDYEAQVEARGISLYEAVTFASLIELETRFDDERSFVSEVIWRRYNDKVPLGIDATIIYGIKDYQGNITRAHLRDRLNPYNSRIHTGLPPTPIGSPSLDSLRAVLTPSELGYYYYVVDPELGGRHHFTKTLAEHNRAVRKLVTAQRSERRKEQAAKYKEREEAQRAARAQRRAAQESRRTQGSATDEQGERERRGSRTRANPRAPESNTRDRLVHDERSGDSESDFDLDEDFASEP